MTYQSRSVSLAADMLLSFLVTQLVVAVVANPFHKYPYVFLLDVGNEELQSFNTEQIRLSIPGGSLAVKYPAFGDGDTIGHVRVSGVDFGTDLKASIVQGGPGYKYVVLVFIGNPGVSYDAVVTIETVSSVDDSSNMNSNRENQISEDLNDNDSDKFADDNSQQKSIYSENSLITQSSSNVYKYISSEQSEVDHDVNDDEVHNDDEENGNKEDNGNQSNNNYSFDKSESNTYLKEVHSASTDNDSPLVDSRSGSRYGKYEAFRPLIIGGVRFYPQSAVYTQEEDAKPVYEQEIHIKGDDDEERNDIVNDIKYKDNNNNMDPDYGSPVEY